MTHDSVHVTCRATIRKQYIQRHKTLYTET